MLRSSLIQVGKPSDWHTLFVLSHTPSRKLYVFGLSLPAFQSKQQALGHFKPILAGEENAITVFAFDMDNYQWTTDTDAFTHINKFLSPRRCGLMKSIIDRHIDTGYTALVPRFNFFQNGDGSEAFLIAPLPRSHATNGTHCAALEGTQVIHIQQESIDRSIFTDESMVAVAQKQAQFSCHSLTLNIALPRPWVAASTNNNTTSSDRSIFALDFDRRVLICCATDHQHPLQMGATQVHQLFSHSLPHRDNMRDGIASRNSFVGWRPLSGSQLQLGDLGTIPFSLHLIPASRDLAYPQVALLHSDCPSASPSLRAALGNTTRVMSGSNNTALLHVFDTASKEWEKFAFPCSSSVASSTSSIDAALPPTISSAATLGAKLVLYTGHGDAFLFDGGKKLATHYPMTGSAKTSPRSAAWILPSPHHPSSSLICYGGFTFSVASGKGHLQRLHDVYGWEVDENCWPAEEENGDEKDDLGVIADAPRAKIIEGFTVRQFPSVEDDGREDFRSVSGTSTPIESHSLQRSMSSSTTTSVAPRVVEPTTPRLSLLPPPPRSNRPKAPTSRPPSPTPSFRPSQRTKQHQEQQQTQQTPSRRVAPPRSRPASPILTLSRDDHPQEFALREGLPSAVCSRSVSMTDLASMHNAPCDEEDEPISYGDTSPNVDQIVDSLTQHLAMEQAEKLTTSLAAPAEDQQPAVGPPVPTAFGSPLSRATRSSALLVDRYNSSIAIPAARSASRATTVAVDDDAIVGATNPTERTSYAISDSTPEFPPVTLRATKTVVEKEEIIASSMSRSSSMHHQPLQQGPPAGSSGCINGSMLRAVPYEDWYGGDTTESVRASTFTSGAPPRPHLSLAMETTSDTSSTPRHVDPLQPLRNATASQDDGILWEERTMMSVSPTSGSHHIPASDPHPQPSAPTTENETSEEVFHHRQHDAEVEDEAEELVESEVVVVELSLSPRRCRSESRQCFSPGRRCATMSEDLSGKKLPLLPPALSPNGAGSNELSSMALLRHEPPPEFAAEMAHQQEQEDQHLQHRVGTTTAPSNAVALGHRAINDTPKAPPSNTFRIPRASVDLLRRVFHTAVRGCAFGSTTQLSMRDSEQSTLGTQALCKVLYVLGLLNIDPAFFTDSLFDICYGLLHDGQLRQPTVGAQHQDVEFDPATFEVDVEGFITIVCSVLSMLSHHQSSAVRTIAIEHPLLMPQELHHLAPQAPFVEYLLERVVSVMHSNLKALSILFSPDLAAVVSGNRTSLERWLSAMPSLVQTSNGGPSYHSRMTQKVSDDLRLLCANPPSSSSTGLVFSSFHDDLLSNHHASTKLFSEALYTFETALHFDLQENSPCLGKEPRVQVGVVNILYFALLSFGQLLQNNPRLGDGEAVFSFVDTLLASVAPPPKQHQQPPPRHDPFAPIQQDTTPLRAKQTPLATTNSPLGSPLFVANFGGGPLELKPCDQSAVQCVPAHAPTQRPLSQQGPQQLNAQQHHHNSSVPQQPSQLRVGHDENTNNTIHSFSPKTTAPGSSSSSSLISDVSDALWQRHRQLVQKAFSVAQQRASERVLAGQKVSTSVSKLTLSSPQHFVAVAKGLFPLYLLSMREMTTIGSHHSQQQQQPVGRSLPRASTTTNVAFLPAFVECSLHVFAKKCNLGSVDGLCASGCIPIEEYIGNTVSDLRMLVK